MKNATSVTLLASIALIGWSLSGNLPVHASPASAQSQIALPQSEPYWAWFKFSPGVLENWVIKGDQFNPYIVSAKPKRLGLATAQKKILVVYPRPSSAYDIAITKMFSVFEDKLLDAELTIVNFRNEDQRGHDVMALAEREKFDLILSMGSESTAWLWGNYRQSQIPVVSVCSKDPVVLGQSPGYHLGSGTNFAFTSLNMPIDVQMAYVQELKPKLRNIAVLVDSRNFSAIETQSKPVVDYAKARGIRVLELSVQDPNNAKDELEKMVGAASAQMMRNDPDLSNSLFWVTGSTSVFREIRTINEKAGRAAVVSVVPEIVQGGDDSAVLSIGISFESNAHIAAIYAADILRGRALAGSLKVGVVSPPDIAINFRKVRDIGMTMPFSFFEAAGTIFDYEGQTVRADGVNVKNITN